MNKRYFTYYGYSTQAKNKLERAIMDYFQSISQMLIPEGDLRAFQDTCYKKVTALNAEFSRCQPVNIELTPSYGDKGYIKASGLYAMNFTLYEVEQDFSTKNK